MHESRSLSGDDTVDAVVIGTGAGGAPLLASLAEAGLSVVALEAGRAFQPHEHVADELAADIYWMEERLSGGDDPTAFVQLIPAWASAGRCYTGAHSARVLTLATFDSRH